MNFINKSFCPHEYLNAISFWNLKMTIIPEVIIIETNATRKGKVKPCVRSFVREKNEQYLFTPESIGSWFSLCFRHHEGLTSTNEI